MSKPFGVNLHDSAPCGIYTRTLHEHYTVNSYVRYKEKHYHLDLIKRIGGVPGTPYIETRNYIFIQDHALQRDQEFLKAKKIDVANQPVNQVVQQDHYFLVGEGSEAYDSRYFGEVHKNMLQPYKHIFSIKCPKKHMQ